MAIKVSDLFDGVTEQNITAHVPDIDIIGGGWTQTANNNVKLDGIGGIKFSASNTSCWIDTGVSDQELTVNINSGGVDNRFSFFLRRNGLAQGSETAYKFNFKGGLTGQELTIAKVIGGVETTILTGPFTVNLANTYEHKVVANGTDLEWWINGTLELSTTHSEITTGTFFSLQHNLWIDGSLRILDASVSDFVTGLVAGLYGKYGIQNGTPIYGEGGIASGTVIYKD